MSVPIDTLIDTSVYLLTHDVIVYICRLLTSRERSFRCTISKSWSDAVIAASKLESGIPMMYDVTADAISPVTNKTLMDMSLQEYTLEQKRAIMCDYHLVARLKCPSSRFLYMSCYGGNIDVVKMMLAHPVEQSSESLNRGLYNACATPNIELINMLLDKGALVGEGYNGACRSGNVDILKYLDAKLTLTITFIQGLRLAARHGVQSSVLYIIDKWPHYSFFALLEAASIPQYDLIKVLLERGSAYNTLSTTVNTPHNTTYCRTVIQLLIIQMCNVQRTSTSDTTKYLYDMLKTARQSNQQDINHIKSIIDTNVINKVYMETFVSACSLDDHRM